MPFLVARFRKAEVVLATGNGVRLPVGSNCWLNPRRRMPPSIAMLHTSEGVVVVSHLGYVSSVSVNQWARRSYPVESDDRCIATKYRRVNRVFYAVMRFY